MATRIPLLMPQCIGSIGVDVRERYDAIDVRICGGECKYHSPSLGPTLALDRRIVNRLSSRNPTVSSMIKSEAHAAIRQACAAAAAARPTLQWRAGAEPKNVTMGNIHDPGRIRLRGLLTTCISTAVQKQIRPLLVHDAP